MQFVLFLPVIVIIFYILPGKSKTIWLLLASYYFYMCWNAKYIVLILLSTIVTFIAGILLEKIESPVQRRTILIGNLIINLGILFFFKYFNWLAGDLGKLVGKDISLKILLPVGISFYTFQAIGYTIDVFQRNVKAERNFWTYALFVSFFPQLVAGPIERSGNLIKQVKDIPTKQISLEDITNGLQLIAYGYFLKLIIADRAAIYVQKVFDNYTDYGFLELFIGAILFSIQILCDFNGYTTIAIGSAQIMGVNLMKNFKQPYFSTNTKDFWKRWHISLSSWFADYLYIPLGGNRKGFLRTQMNTLITFILSGLWHGASWTYVIWGLLHGLYRIVGNIKSLFIKSNNTLYANRFIHRIITFFLVVIAWVFFRADTLKTAFGYFTAMFSSYQKVSLMEVTYDWYEWIILILGVLIMSLVDIAHEKNVEIRPQLMAQPVWFRFIIYLATFWIIILFGVYGAKNDENAFIYFRF